MMPGGLLLSLFVLCAAQIDSNEAAPQRRSLVWYKPETFNFEPSLQTLEHNSDSVTDVVLYCGFGINTRGEFVHNISHGSGPQAYELCPEAIRRISNLGMRAILIAKTEHQQLSTVQAAMRHPQSTIDGMVAACNNIPGVSGWNIDWETPAGSSSEQPANHAKMVVFLQQARQALHAVNCSLTMDVGDGRSINEDTPAYINATDGLWDMSTYHGTSLQEWTERFLKAQNSTKVGIGFADYDTTGWDSTQESVVARLRLIQERGYTRIAVFHLNTSKGIPQPFYWPLMKGFLQGPSASAA